MMGRVWCTRTAVAELRTRMQLNEVADGNVVADVCLLVDDGVVRRDRVATMTCASKASRELRREAVIVRRQALMVQANGRG